MSAPPNANRLPPSIQALGIDPNRIEQARPEVRAAFYAAQAEQQRQAEAEARKQAQAEAEEAQKREAAIRAANSRVASDPLAQQGRAKITDQQAADNLKSFLTSGSSIKQLQAAGYDVDYLTYSINPKTGAIENLQGFKFVPTSTPAPESPAFGSLTLSQAKAAFQNPAQLDKAGMQAGYAQLQKAQRQVGDYYTKPIFGSLTASQAANSLYIPNIRAQEAAMASNIKEATTKHYEVNLEDSFSQKPASVKEFFVPDPTNPFDIRTRDVEAPQTFKGQEPPKAPAGGVLDAFVGTLANLPKGVAKTGQEQIFKQTSDIELYPEVEGSVYSALLGLGGRAVEGKPADVNLLFFSRDMGNLGRMIQENPQWAAGSLAASAVFFIPNKVIKPLQFGIEALGLFGRATKQASKISQAVERIFDIETTGVQAAKISKTGSELVPLTRTRFGFTEARPVTVPTFRYAPVVNIPGTSVSLKIPNFMPGLTKTTARQLAKPDAFIIQSGLDDVGLIGTKTGTTEIARELVPREEAARLVGQGAGKLPEVTAKTYTEIAQSEASVLKRADAGIFTQGPTPADIVYNPIVKQTGGSKVSESIPFVSLFGYSNKELLRSTRTFEAGLTVAGEATRPTKPFRPFDFSKPASQGERAAEEGPLNLMMAGAKTEKQAKAITKAMLEGVKEAEKSTKNADLAKAALGLYGDTGSSKKANSLTGLGEGYDQFLVSPAGVDSLAKQYLQQFVTPTSKTKLDTTPIQGSKSFNPFNLIPKLPTTTDQKLTPLMTPFFTPSTRPLTVPTTTPYTVPQTTPIQTPLEVPLQTPLEVPFNVPTTIPKPPREPRPPKIPVATSTTKKKRRPENPFFVRKGWTIWNVPNVFVINTKELYRNMGLLPPKKRRGQK